jgi:hypothetical protein
MGIEHLSRKQCIEAGVAVYDVLSRDIRIDLKLFAVLQQPLGFLNRGQSPILFLEFFRNVLKDMTIGNTISNIHANIFDGPFLTISCHMVVEPPNKNFFRLELIHNAFFLIFGLEHHHFRHTADVDMSEDVDSDDLPDETENNMLFLLANQLRGHVNNHTPDRLG